MFPDPFRISLRKCLTARKSAISGVLRFRVCFGALLEGNKEHPQTQHTRKRRFSERSIFCAFGCVAFSSAFYSPLNNDRPCGENSALESHPGEFQECKTENSKSVSVSYFTQTQFENNLIVRVGLT